jgi:iron complex transport system ATP-binding protein
MTAIIDVKDLYVERDVVILDHLNWTVQEGENWVILGANGSGKTTLLSCLTGYFAYTRGSIRVLGEEHGRTDWRELRKRIGFVSAILNERIDRPATALEMVVSGKDAMLNFAMDVTADDVDRAREILDRINCRQHADRPWLRLSVGERQRVMIGRALMSGAPLLILDEACAGLDPVARERFLEFIDELAREEQAPALVLVTHHVEEIMPAFTHVLVLKQGKALAHGPVATTLNEDLLEEAYGAPVTLHRDGARFRIET